MLPLQHGCFCRVTAAPALTAGVVKLGLQFALFVAMLFLLLSAEQEPLQQAMRILPMSESAREHTAASFSQALRGVFLSALKLAVFHSLFTWVTFRAFSIQLVYVGTLASALCSLLPLVQVWMVAIPAALQLVVQVRDTPPIVTVVHCCCWCWVCHRFSLLLASQADYS